MKLSNDSLIEALKEQGIEASVQKETDQVSFTFENDDQKFPSFIRSMNDGELVQIMIFLPVSLEEKHLTEVARFLHRANKELDIPGFCLDEASSTIFYRIVIPTLHGEIEDSLFHTYIHSSLSICVSFCHIIHALAIGAMTMKEIEDSLKQS